jgi:GNAT superfamily N-acetyltransferase
VTDSASTSTASASPPATSAEGDSHVVIRRAVDADAPVLAALAERIFIDTYLPSTRAEDVAAYVAQAFGPEKQAAEIADPAVTYLLAEVDGEPAAYAFLRSGAETPIGVGPGALEVARFYVRHAWHGRGLAARLMDAVVEEAARRGARTLWLMVWQQNPRALAFYLKHGFRIAGQAQFQMGADLQTDHVMVRRVS